jgi:hypothetical protein
MANFGPIRSRRFALQNVFVIRKQARHHAKKKLPHPALFGQRNAPFRAEHRGPNNRAAAVLAGGQTCFLRQLIHRRLFIRRNGKARTEAA